jgi:hypothetical protein
MPGRGPGHSIRNSAAAPARDQYREAAAPRASLRPGYRLPSRRAGGACSSAWEANDQDQAAKNATLAAVNEIFAESFSPADGWSFEGCEGALGHTFCSWNRSNGGELRIGVINAVEGPYFVADEAQFT